MLVVRPSGDAARADRCSGAARIGIVFATAVLGALNAGAGCRTCRGPAKPPADHAGCTPGLSAMVRGIDFIPQHTTNWCWAASAQMTMGGVANGPAQCRQATDRFQPPSCACGDCSVDTFWSHPCNRPGLPDYEAYGFQAVCQDEPLAWDMLRKELSDAPGCPNRPVAFSWSWRKGTQEAFDASGHMMVVYGYDEIDGRRLLHVIDPMTPNEACAARERLMTYEEFREGADHTHHVDYFAIRKRGAP